MEMLHHGEPSTKMAVPPNRPRSQLHLRRRVTDSVLANRRAATSYAATSCVVVICNRRRSDGGRVGAEPRCLAPLLRPRLGAPWVGPLTASMSDFSSTGKVRISAWVCERGTA